MSDLLIIGAGGHGRVVAEAAELMGLWNNIAFLDDRTDAEMVLGHRIIGKLDDYGRFTDMYDYAIICIGYNEKRMNLMDRVLKLGYKIPIIIHPKAFVSKYCSIEAGSVILAGVVINTGVRIGKGCIININSCVDHDSILYDGVHVCSGAVVRSMCGIGRLAYVGAGSCVKSGTQLGECFVLEDGRVVG